MSRFYGSLCSETGTGMYLRTVC